MTTTHTPSPWMFSFESIDPEWAVLTTCGGAVIANVNADKKQLANARLIAAAPDLLEALTDLFDAGMESVLMGDGKHDQIEAIKKAIAAIAKATGESL